ncbi:MAG TPA: response regulator, partial [Polyangiaceae bacterium]|nr:response regulator [Polyangiaceae bacterium]
SALEAEMAKRALEQLYRVEVFADGPSMLESLSTHSRPELLILDWQLPGMSGIEICRFLRASLDEMAMPILMLTVQGHKPDIVEGLSAGANDYLTKPYDPAELLARAKALGRTRSLYDELQLERRRLQDLFTALPAYVAMTSGAEHTARFVNPALHALWGNGELTGRPLSQVYPELLAGGHMALWDEVYRTGVPVHIADWKLQIRRGESDEERSFSLSLLPQHNSAEQVIGVLAFALDVTEQLQARRKEDAAIAERESLLAQAQSAWARADSANRTKDEFLATVSHELRTPLNAITGWVHLLRRGAVSPQKTPHALATIERNARAQTQLIDDLLDVSRIVSGKLSLEPAELSLSHVVELAIEAVRPAADAKQVLLEAKLEPLMYRADAARLQQVVSNLLTNAVKFTPAGGRIDVTLKATPQGVELAVKDSGRGIDPSFIDHVFDRFRQAEATLARNHGGLGLGLAIVRHLIELHGGSVSASSPGRGRGATFTVRLPQLPELPTSPWREEPSSPHASASPRDLSERLRGRSVLLVEDDDDSREVIVKMLEECGLRVSQASNTSEALQLVRGERPDLLVSDIGMPNEDGLTLIRRLRALPEQEGGHTPAIALTAYARSEDRAKTSSAGFNLHLAKPVGLVELSEALASLT